MTYTMKIPKFYGKSSLMEKFAFFRWRLFNILNFMKTKPNMINTTSKEKFDRDIQDQKFVKLVEKLASNFASPIFL